MLKKAKKEVVLTYKTTVKHFKVNQGVNGVLQTVNQVNPHPQIQHKTSVVNPTHKTQVIVTTKRLFAVATR